MKTQKTFQNASLVSVVNGSIVVKDSTGEEHTFVNASIVSVNNGTIIIETEWEPKRGELIKMEGNGTNCYAIFKSKNAYYLYDYGYRFIGGNNLIINEYGWYLMDASISPVTPEEAVAFDDFCKSQGKIWNKKTLQWENYRWKPEIDERYFTIVVGGGNSWISRYRWESDDIDNHNYEIGNCFKTREEAEAKLEQIKKLLLEV